jgi:hypothetical protein
MMTPSKMIKKICLIAFFMSACFSLQAKPVAATVRVENDRAELYFDGEKQGRMLGRVDLPPVLGPEKVRVYQPIGIKTYITSMPIPNFMCWDGADTFDFELYEVYLDRLIAKDPDIKLILFMGFSSAGPYQWIKNHPEEMTMGFDGSRLNAPSIGSEKWLVDSTAAMKRFVQHFEQSPYAEHIVGYNPILSGNEWFGYMREANEFESLQDYSKPMLTHFRQWLRVHYREDVDALRSAWKDPEVTFETAALPTPQQRVHPDLDTLYPYAEAGMQAPDYFRCYNERNADVAIAYCKAIKEAASRPVLTGLMHGYSFCARHGAPYPQHVASNGGVMKILESEYIDFLHSPYHYYNRSFGGTHFSQHAVDSVMQHGKLMIDQSDTDTHLGDRKWNGRCANTMFESIHITKRDVAYSIAKNISGYFLDINPGVFRGNLSPQPYEIITYDDPQLQAVMTQLRQLHDENQARATQPVSEVALITSNTDQYYRRPENIYGNLYAEAIRQWILPYTSTPFDDYILEDFDSIDRPYKVYIFSNAQYVPSELRAKIRAKLKADNATALWFHAAGYIDETGHSLDNMKALTGIEFGMDTQRDFIQVELTSSGHNLLKGVDAQDYGSDISPEFFQSDLTWIAWNKEIEQYRFTPRFFAEDERAEALGDLRGVGPGGLVVKQADGFRSVYSAAPMPPSKLLENLFRDAGVHVYSESADLVYANSGYVFIVASDDGSRVVKLPRVCKVSDAFQGTVLANSADSVRLDMKHGEVRALRID